MIKLEGETSLERKKVKMVYSSCIVFGLTRLHKIKEYNDKIFHKQKFRGLGYFQVS